MQTACESGKYAGAGSDACTHCAAGTFANGSAWAACKACIVQDGTDAVHVGFTNMAGQSSCAKHTTCPGATFVNGPGEYQTKAAAPHHDRECAPLSVCHKYQYVRSAPTATTDRVCTACPFAHRATDDWSGCYAYKCTHLVCKHFVHKCSKFNLHDSTRTHLSTASTTRIAYDRTIHPHHGNECDGSTRFKTIVVHHDHTEYTCQNGHLCGLGVVSGDHTKCECAPSVLQPSVSRPSISTRAVGEEGKPNLSTPQAQAQLQTQSQPQSAALSWEAHGDTLQARHPDSNRPRSWRDGFAPEGRANVRSPSAAVAYLGAEAGEALAASDFD